MRVSPVVLLIWTAVHSQDTPETVVSVSDVKPNTNLADMVDPVVPDAPPPVLNKFTWSSGSSPGFSAIPGAGENGSDLDGKVASDTSSIDIDKVLDSKIVEQITERLESFSNSSERLATIIRSAGDVLKKELDLIETEASSNQNGHVVIDVGLPTDTGKADGEDLGSVFGGTIPDFNHRKFNVMIREPELIALLDNGMDEYLEGRLTSYLAKIIRVQQQYKAGTSQSAVNGMIEDIRDALEAEIEFVQADLSVLEAIIFENGS